jgi:hypothetical protein
VARNYKHILWDNGPPVSNDDGVSVELKAPARITRLVFRVFRIGIILPLTPLIITPLFSNTNPKQAVALFANPSYPG